MEKQGKRVGRWYCIGRRSGEGLAEFVIYDGIHPIASGVVNSNGIMRWRMECEDDRVHHVNDCFPMALGAAFSMAVECLDREVSA